jgi:hypothetical protein
MSAVEPATMVPPFRFTRRAVDRFIKRVWPTLSSRPCADDREALSLLCGASHLAEAMPRRSILGDVLWSVRDPAMRWISKPGEYRGQRAAVVVTVLAGSDDAEAEERAEREVIEASRRLAAFPDLGLEESTTPAPEGYVYRAWLQTEMHRLSLEKARIAAINANGDRKRQIEIAREKTARHAISHAHEALFCELLARLAEVDAAGSADLLERARERVAKWEAEGRLGEDEQ